MAIFAGLRIGMLVLSFTSSSARIYARDMQPSMRHSAPCFSASLAALISSCSVRFRFLANSNTAIDRGWIAASLCVISYRATIALAVGMSLSKATTRPNRSATCCERQIDASAGPMTGILISSRAREARGRRSSRARPPRSGLGRLEAPQNLWDGHVFFHRRLNRDRPGF